MQSKQLSALKSLARILKKLLKKYKVYDFIIFGSYVKNKMNPPDIDVAALTEVKDPGLIGELRSAISMKNVHLQIVSLDDFIQSTLPYYLLSEGYSVKHGWFITDKLPVKRVMQYSFSLVNLTQTAKVMFNKALRELIEVTKSEKIGKGAVLVPVSSSGEFDDFFKQWERTVKKKDFIEIKQS